MKYNVKKIIGWSILVPFLVLASIFILVRAIWAIYGIFTASIPFVAFVSVLGIVGFAVFLNLILLKLGLIKTGVRRETIINLDFLKAFDKCQGVLEDLHVENLKKEQEQGLIRGYVRYPWYAPERKSQRVLVRLASLGD